MLKTLRRATQILHRVTPRLSADETVLTIDSEGGVSLRSPEGRHSAQLHPGAFSELVEMLELFRFKRTAGTYGDAMAEFTHDLEVHEGPGKKGRLTLRLNHEYGAFVGDAPPGLREFITLLDRLEHYLRDEADTDQLADEGFLDQLGRGIEFPYFNPHGEPGDFTLIGKDGERIPAASRQWSMPYADGLLPFQDPDDQFGFVKANGELVITPRFQMTYGFSEGLAAVKVGGRWGYINQAGGVVIEPQFAAADMFYDGMAQVTKADETGFINRTGEFWALPRGARQVHPFSGGFAAFQALSRIGEPAWGFVNRAGEIVIKPTFERVGKFTAGLAPAAEEDQYGFVTSAGEWTIEQRYDHAEPFSQGLAAVYEGARAGYINVDGEWMIEPRFQEALSFSEGMAAVKLGRRWGYLKREGGFAIEPCYEAAEPFADGLAAVRVDHRWGYVDPEGKIVVAPTYENARPFVDGVACVRAFARRKPLVATGSQKVIVNLRRAEPEPTAGQ